MTDPRFPTLSLQTWPHESNELDSFYGNPRGTGDNVSPTWEAENLTKIVPPWAMNMDGSSVSHITIHKKAADSLLRILNAVWAFVGQDQSKIDAAHLNEWGGSYNFRVNVNNPSKLSVHAYAAAFDIAPNENPNGKAWVDNGTMLPRWFIDACLAEGWSWGGDFNVTKDPMHFQATFNAHDDAPKDVPVAIPSPPIVPTVPVPVPASPDLLTDLRQFILDRTGMVAETEAFKADVIKDLSAISAKIQAFKLQASAIAVTPSDPLIPTVPVTPTAPVVPTVSVVFTNITATVFGGASDHNTSAYDNHVITDTELGCALPFHFKGTRPQVRVCIGNKSVICNIVDVGPWNTNDPYWDTGSRPQSETCHNAGQPLPDGPNKGKVPTNPAGIDLTPAAAEAIGLNGKGVVNWNFVQTGAPTVATTPTTVNVPVQSAVASKINWTSIVQMAATLLTVFSGGKFDISPEVQVAIVGVIGTIFPLITMAFRTFGTTTITPQSLSSSVR